MEIIPDTLAVKEAALVAFSILIAGLFKLLGDAINSGNDLKKGTIVTAAKSEERLRQDLMTRLEMAEERQDRYELELAACRESHLDCERRAANLEVRVSKLENGHCHD